MEKTNIAAEFIITGSSFDPDYLSTIIGIKPSKSWVVGSHIRGTNKIHEFSLWEIQTNYKISFDINIQLSELYELFKNKVGILKDLKNKFNFKMTVGIIINIRHNETPSIHFEHWFINFINDIGAEIDIDLYVD